MSLEKRLSVVMRAVTLRWILPVPSALSNVTCFAFWHCTVRRRVRLWSLNDRAICGYIKAASWISVR
jgi:hypothetical protein